MIMELQQVTSFLKDLGLPAAIWAVLIALVKALIDTRQRRSKESLLDWLAQPSAMEPFKGDDRALRALHELQQLLIFERAFDLKAESGVRNELLLFAESQHESLRFHEVLDAGRLLSRLPLVQLSSPKVLNAFKGSRFFKLAGYLSLGFGYILLAGSTYLAMNGHLRWSTLAGTLGFGGWMMLMGLYNLKHARCEIVAAFLSWRSENQRSSLQV